MATVIIYPNASTITILYPTGELPIEDVAKKDVPPGIPYKIIDSSVLPIDRTFRDAWTADFSNPDGYGMGHDVWTLSKGGN